MQIVILRIMDHQTVSILIIKENSLDKLKLSHTLACLLDVSGDGVRDELVDDILEVCGADFPLDDVDHLLTDVPDLLGLGIAGLLGGHVLLAGEPDAEDAEHVSVSGLDINVALDQGLPLLDHGPQLVGGQAHAVEVGQAVLTLKVKILV